MSNFIVHNAPTIGKLNFIQLNLARKKPTVIVEPNHLWKFLGYVSRLLSFFTSNGTLGTSINLIATKRIAHLSSRMAIHLSMDFGVNSHTNGENGALKLQRITHTKTNLEYI
jgi:hypothetical protein